MLSFIEYEVKGHLKTLKFKYISCYLLSYTHYRTYQAYQYLNTSHVIFYQTLLNGENKPLIFKYISCYLLSGKPVYFNFSSLSFKYISCYLLSVTPSSFIIPTGIFKYISCYLLSDRTEDIFPWSRI